MKRALQVLGGTLLGLVLAEGMFRVVDEGAFAHVNFYVPDADLGVRLEPGASERISFGGNPVTTALVNAEGYRGADWGPAQDGEVIVVGDSQVFGLGVEEDETASAVLATKLGRPVRNAGVPTYGPTEYLAVIDELLAARKARTVVLVLNFSNDLFEKDVPNTKRHAVWDGWAVRLETAPAEVTDFPGRKWLMSESHLVMAARRAWWTPPEAWGQGVASEGTWEQIVMAAPAAEPTTAASIVAEPQVAAQVQAASAERVRVERELVGLYRDALVDLGYEAVEDLAVRAAVEHAHPGDIVWEEYGEGARMIRVTAAHLREGARIRGGLEGRLAAWVEKHPRDPRATEIRAALASRTSLDAELSALATRVAEEIDGRSPLLDVVEAAKARCDAAGAELVVVALPLDVMVSDVEWDKYGEPRPAPGGPLDMTATRALLAELVEDTTRMGVRALDATAALGAAEPGAFLNADLHMSPKGQAALGAALADVIAAPAPFAVPRAGLPPGRSRVPSWAELELATEVTVTGSTKNHCSTRQLREWLLVDCTTPPVVEIFGRPPPFAPPRSVRVVSGGEALVGHGAGHVVLVLPLVPGRGAEADFLWSDRTERLTIAWEGDTPVMAFTPAESATPTETPACVARLGATARHTWFGDVTRGCASSYPDDCTQQLTCAAGTRSPLPTCSAGQVNAGAAGHCYTLCDVARPCGSGTCTEWRGAGVCM
jgi:hypothetical protein